MSQTTSSNSTTEHPPTASRSAINSVARIAAVGFENVFLFFERQIAAHSIVGTTPIISSDGFPWAPTMEDNWRQIRQELDRILVYQEALPNFQDISAEQSALTQDDKWKTFFLFGYGTKVEANCSRCPRTTELLESIPGVTTAFFSIFGPNKQIPPHRGPWKGVVRYHLALKVPDPASSCGIRVADETVHWSEGRGFFFDDTYDHEAWNNTSDTRVVLFLDVIRPLRFPYSEFNKAIIYLIARTSYVRNAMKNHEAWERRFEKWLSSRGNQNEPAS
jgi:aspartyl/asparaginyl beta-hydroxylase (cupin superfamily)